MILSNLFFQPLHIHSIWSNPCLFSLFRRWRFRGQDRATRLKKGNLICENIKPFCLIKLYFPWVDDTLVIVYPVVILSGFYGLYIPWKVTGMLHSTSARAISDRSLALRMRRYPGLWEPGATTMVSSTPEGSALHYHKTILNIVGVRLEILCLQCCWCTIILVHSIGSLNKQGLWGVGVWFLPYPGLLGLYIQLADLHSNKEQKKLREQQVLHILFCLLFFL